MKEKDLLHHCRYYHGEKEAPKPDVKAMFWQYERRWLQLMTDAKGTTLEDMIDDYNLAGLAHFQMQDDTPLSLKALLFSRFCHWRSASLQDCAEEFQKWYQEEYL